MSVVIITGSAGLIGSEATEFYANLGFDVVGIDNNMRQKFFGQDGNTLWNRTKLEKSLGKKYKHFDVDIRDRDELDKIFNMYKENISLIIHTAAQPSHDWAAIDPITDYSVNALGTLNLLEVFRKYCPSAVFIFTSTNKVYGDQPNKLNFIELEKRWEVSEESKYQNGISEEMSIDNCLHSLFGASKLSADILVQEYGRYFDLKTVSFRGGVLSGSKQSGAQLHGFINYLMKCAITNTAYTIFGYKGKQVRDVIDSKDVISAFHTFFLSPQKGEVYNLGGGRDSNISILEAIDLAQEITGKEMIYEYREAPRRGDHIWYISNMTKFKSHYPLWNIKNRIKEIMEGIYLENKNRWLEK